MNKVFVVAAMVIVIYALSMSLSIEFFVFIQFGRLR